MNITEKKRENTFGVLNTKSQLVIPKPIREYLGVGPGDLIIFYKHGSGMKLKPPLVVIKRGEVIPSNHKEDVK